VSQFEALLDIVVAPGKVFAQLRQTPWWGLALSLYVAFKILIVFTLIPFTMETTEPVLRNQLLQGGLPADQVESVVESQFHGPLRVVSSVNEGVKGVVGICALGALIWVSLVVFTGSASKVRFKRALAIVSYATVPLVIGNLCVVVFALLGVPNYLNPAVFLQWITNNTLLLSVATFVDPFNLWMAGLIVAGNKVVFDIQTYGKSLLYLSPPLAGFVTVLSLFTWWTT
jgi:hypothetical protein